jgi:hypothetical protein
VRCVGRQRREIGGEVFVEQRSVPFSPQKRHDILIFHPETGSNNLLTVGDQSARYWRDRVRSMAPPTPKPGSGRRGWPSQNSKLHLNLSRVRY